VVGVGSDNGLMRELDRQHKVGAGTGIVLCVHDTLYF